MGNSHCHTNANGGYKGGFTSNPFTANWDNPFGSVNQYPFAQLQQTLLSIVSTLIAQGSSLAGWLLTSYAVIVLVLLLMLWTQATVQYQKTVYNMALGNFVKMSGDPSLWIIWSLLRLGLSLVLSLVVSILWPVWFPCIVIRLTFELFYNMFSLIRTLTTIVIRGLAMTPIILVAFQYPIYNLWIYCRFKGKNDTDTAPNVPTPPQPTLLKTRIHNSATQLEDTLMELQDVCENSYKTHPCTQDVASEKKKQKQKQKGHENRMF